MNCTRAVLPHMIASGHGRVITIVSDAGRVGEAHMAPYAAAKAGAAGFTRAIAREVGRDGITVNNVALATVDTMGLADMARMEAPPDRSSLWAGLFDLRENLIRAATDLRALAA